MTSFKREYTAEDLAPDAEVRYVELWMEGDDAQIRVAEHKRDMEDEDFSASQGSTSSQDSISSEEAASSQSTSGSSHESHWEDEMDADEDKEDDGGETGTVHMELEDDDDPLPATQVRQASPEANGNPNAIANGKLDGRRLRLIAEVFAEWEKSLNGIVELHHSWVRVAQVLYELDPQTIEAARFFIIAHREFFLKSTLSEADEDLIYGMALSEWEDHMEKARKYISISGQRHP
ncbi:hypothetical protein BV20DRAFT_1117530 [Pilatotrama ljubarskyi]|nr:hypothetical protein BV20DRAFT_1117530 [Pilatotrama ljubarskyi]